MFGRIALGRAGIAIGAVALSSCSEPVEPLPSDAAAELNAALAKAIHEAGFLCNSVLAASSTETPVRMWRVVCEDLLVYIAMLDEDDALHVEPVPYVDPQVSRVTAMRVPDLGAGFRR
jgi:hypothetical protein